MTDEADALLAWDAVSAFWQAAADGDDAALGDLLGGWWLDAMRADGFDSPSAYVRHVAGVTAEGCRSTPCSQTLRRSRHGWAVGCVPGTRPGRETDGREPALALLVTVRDGVALVRGPAPQGAWDGAELVDVASLARRRAMD